VRLNWRKVVALVLVCELLLLYWSALQQKEADRQLQKQSSQLLEQSGQPQELPVSAAPQPAPPPRPNPPLKQG
jgi:hypothetical protein